MNQATLEAKFKDKFNKTAGYSGFSPGRINLIGEHIDYCGGLVLPMTIDRGTYAVFAANDNDLVRVFSSRFDELIELPISDPAMDQMPHWGQFVLGVMTLLGKNYRLSGFDIYVEDDIAAGGLSSSASFSLLIAGAALMAADQFVDTDAKRLQLALICQQVEHQFLNVQCGIMDQASVALGGVLELDCDSLQFKRIDADTGDYRIVVMDSGKQRTLASSKYNERVSELTSISKQLGLFDKGKLCGIPFEELDVALKGLDEEVLKARLRHVVTENQRVKESCERLRHGDVAGFGELLNQSHRSLRDDYEVTGDELDALVAHSQAQPGVVGARMTGAGFGGCCLALVHKDEIEAHNHQVARAYKQTTGLEANFFAVNKSDGLTFRAI